VSYPRPQRVPSHSLAAGVGNSSRQEECYRVKNQLVQVGRSPIDYWVVYGAKMKKPLFNRFPFWKVKNPVADKTKK
jgi:hypothetical protein